MIMKENYIIFVSRMPLTNQGQIPHFLVEKLQKQINQQRRKRTALLHRAPGSQQCLQRQSHARPWPCRCGALHRAEISPSVE